MQLSVIVPTLNAGGGLPHALAALLRGRRTLGLELIVSDGGSEDASVAQAVEAGARVAVGPPGRGGQLYRGAAMAGGDWLLFLHADTVLAPGWADEVATFMQGDPLRAGYFRLAFDDAAPAARRLERIVAWRSRVLGLPYGDQGLLLSRELYDRAGGYRALPLMEDVDLVRRIGRARLRPLRSVATTSAARYRRGYVRRSARNLMCLSLYFLGVPPERIRRLYA